MCLFNTHIVNHFQNDTKLINKRPHSVLCTSLCPKMAITLIFLVSEINETGQNNKKIIESLTA